MISETNTLTEVSSNKDGQSWLNLQRISYRALHSATSAGIKPTCVGENIVSNNRLLLILPSRARPATDLSEAQRGRVWLCGLMSGASRLLAPTESLVSSSKDGDLQEMIRKHPAPQPDDIPPSLPALRPFRRCYPDEVMEVLKTFSCDSSGGLDGLTAQHLLDMSFGAFCSKSWPMSVN